MGLIDRIIEDVKVITSNTNDWPVSITLTSPLGVSYTLAGLHSKHHLAVDGNGNRVNSKNAHCSFTESALVALGITVRNENQEIALKNWKVYAPDSSGVVKHYIIREVWPSETTGLIVCILGDFE